MNQTSYQEIQLEILDENDTGLRLDQYLAKSLEIPRERIKNLFAMGLIKKLNSKKECKLSNKTEINDSFFIKIPDTDINKKNPVSDLLLSDYIVFEDEQVIVIKKPTGLLTHGKPGDNYEASVSDLAKVYLGIESGVGQEGREFIVHRLDRETSGLMVLAKTIESYEFLNEAFRNKEVKKKYLGLVWGVPNPTCHSVKKNIVRDRIHRTKMHVCAKNVEGKEAITHYRVKKILFDGAISLVEFILETGRTHQIRAHSNFIRCGIVGDKLYGQPKEHLLNENFVHIKANIKNVSHHMLHSYHLSFAHPATKETMNFESELPNEMREIIGLDK